MVSLGPARVTVAGVPVATAVAALCLLASPAATWARDAGDGHRKVVDLTASIPLSASRFQRVLSRLSVDQIGDLRGVIAGGSRTTTVGARASRGQRNVRGMMRSFRAGQVRLAEGRARRLRELISVGGAERAAVLRNALADARAAIDALQSAHPLLERVRVRLSGPTDPISREVRQYAARLGIAIADVPSVVRARAAGPGDIEANDIPASVYAPRYAVAGTDYLPLGDAYPPPPPGTRGSHLKHHYAYFKWEDQQHLSWFSEGPHRGFEIQIEPMSETELWSDGWADPIVINWSSDMPAPYLDDLAFDGAIKGFAVGSADGAALEPGSEYFAEWETNEGETDVGRARTLGQATVGPAETTTFNTGAGPVTRPPDSGGIQETAYCALHPQDSGCFFARDSVEFGLFRIEDRAEFGPIGLVRYGSCPWGMVPTNGALGRACAWNT